MARHCGVAPFCLLWPSLYSSIRQCQPAALGQRTDAHRPNRPQGARADAAILSELPFRANGLALVQSLRTCLLVDREGCDCGAEPLEHVKVGALQQRRT